MSRSAGAAAFGDLGGTDAQMRGGLGGLFHGPRQDGANAPVFEHQQAGDGAAGRRGDVVAQRGRMAPGGEHHARGAERRLRHQREGELPRQTHAHAGIGQRFHDQEVVARPAAAQRGDRIEVDLVDGQAPAHCFENRLRALQVGLGCVAARRRSRSCPSPTTAGVLGMARMIGFSVPSIDSSRSVPTPARIDISSVSRRSPALRSAASATGASFGFTAQKNQIGAGHARGVVGFDGDAERGRGRLAGDGILVAGPKTVVRDMLAGEESAQ